jgi:hypothetical protein
VDVSIVPVIHNVGRTQEAVAKHRERVFEGTQNTEVGVGIVPDKVIVGNADCRASKGEVDRAALAFFEAVNKVEIGVRDFGCRRECSQQLAENC